MQQCSSVHEGDLVAKCYYAKRKLVWEVLDNGLKSKIEIQWSDITGLKANMPEKGPASLHVEVIYIYWIIRNSMQQVLYPICSFLVRVNILV